MNGTTTRRAALPCAALALAAALAVVTGCRDAASATRAGRAARTLRLHSCIRAGGLARCGTLEVYEDRRTRRGRRVPLAVVVLPARGGGAAREPDPIFLLTGGPGLGAAKEAGTARLLDAARDARDVVLVDQRGTGGSAALDCDLYDDRHGDAPHVFLGDRFPPAAVRACRAALERRADLARYTTPDAADDLDEVRAALGYERVNLFGISYGTRAALVYLRRHPTRVRSAVLDGVVTTSYPTPLPASAAGDRALSRVFDDCARDAACHGAFPDVAGDYRAALDLLDRAPAPVALPRWAGLSFEPASLDRRAFVEGVWRRLYQSRWARDLPGALHRAARGDFGAFARDVAEDHRRSWPRNSAGALLSIVCAEDVPFVAPADVARAESASLVGAPLARELMAACDGWPRAPLPDGYREPVRSDVPVLLLSGELDPISPPEWAAEAARTLPNARHVVHAFAGHADDDACTLGLAAEFFARPDPRALDANCAAVARRPPFRLE